MQAPAAAGCQSLIGLYYSLISQDRLPPQLQAAGILAFVTADVVPDDSTRFYFVGIDKARFRKPVEPGDQVVLTAKLERTMRGIWKFSAVAYVGDAEVASAELMVAPETAQKA